MSKISSANFDSPFFKQILNRITFVLSTVCSQVGKSPAYSLADVGAMMVLLDYQQTMADYISLVKKIIQALCRCFESQAQKKDEQTNVPVLEYVNTHALTPNISLDMLVEEFGYSTGYWSKFFSEKIGVFFSDYIWNIRLEYAKEKLVSTNEPIVQIVHEVGYIDQTSFNRKFKTSVGMTPGQYRKILAKNDILENLTDK